MGGAENQTNTVECKIGDICHKTRPGEFWSNALQPYQTSMFVSPDSPGRVWWGILRQSGEIRVEWPVCSETALKKPSKTHQIHHFRHTMVRHL